MEKRAKGLNPKHKGGLRRKRITAQGSIAWGWPRTILVPVDLSACSAGSLHWAAGFASELGARLIVLHVREYNISGSWAVDLARTLVSATQDLNNEFAALVGKEVPPMVPSKRLLVAGAPAQRIVQVALDEKADLIMLASHCRTGLDHARLGSVTEQVVRHAPCPVLVQPMRSFVPAEYENKGRAK